MMSWKETKSGIFSVKFIYDSLPKGGRDYFPTKT